MVARGSPDWKPRNDSGLLRDLTNTVAAEREENAMTRRSVASTPSRRIAEMRVRLVRNWPWLVARTVLALMVSLAAALSSAFAAGALVSIMAGYLFADGILAMACGGRTPQPHGRCAWMMLEGLLDIAAGIAVVMLPVTAIYALVVVVGVWAATSGMVFFQASFRIERALGGPVVALAGMTSVLAGLLLLAWPSRNMALLALWFATYAVLFGILLGTFAHLARSKSKLRSISRLPL